MQEIPWPIIYYHFDVIFKCHLLMLNSETEARNSMTHNLLLISFHFYMSSINTES